MGAPVASHFFLAENNESLTSHQTSTTPLATPPLPPPPSSPPPAQPPPLTPPPLLRPPPPQPHTIDALLVACQPCLKEFCRCILAILYYL